MVSLNRLVPSKVGGMNLVDAIIVGVLKHYLAPVVRPICARVGSGIVAPVVQLVAAGFLGGYLKGKYLRLIPMAIALDAVEQLAAMIAPAIPIPMGGGASQGGGITV